MGVKLLNTFLKTKFSRNIKKVHWEKFQNKKIAVDINNYMYKFLSEQAFESSIIRMCDMFLYYKITPIFVFDGKAPIEKREEIQERKKIRTETKHLYNKEKNILTEKELIEMRRKIVKVTSVETNKAKEIFDLYGFKHINSPSESDILCCKLVKTKKAAACLSEDMDMFVYGCPLILRMYSNTNYITEYNLYFILNSMMIDITSFKHLCLLGNLKNNKKNIFNFYELYLQFYDNKINTTFLDYLLNHQYISESQLNHLNHIYTYYDIDNNDVLTKCPYILFRNRKIYKSEIIRFKQNLVLQQAFCPT